MRCFFIGGRLHLTDMCIRFQHALIATGHSDRYGHRRFVHVRKIDNAHAVCGHAGMGKEHRMGGIRQSDRAAVIRQCCVQQSAKIRRFRHVHFPVGDCCRDRIVQCFTGFAGQGWDLAAEEHRDPVIRQFRQLPCCLFLEYARAWQNDGTIRTIPITKCALPDLRRQENVAVDVVKVDLLMEKLP